MARTRNSHPHPISRLLSGNERRAAPTELNQVLERARALHRIGQWITAILPAELAQRVRIANLHNGRLVMSADSAAWGTRLRYFRSAIIARLAEREVTIRQLDIRVSPHEREPGPPRRPIPISAAAARTIATTAEHIDDPELAAALIRLRESGTRHGPGTRMDEE